MKPIGGRGADTDIEAAGIPARFDLCQDIVAPGGTISNAGVHRVKVARHVERLWSHNVTIPVGLMDTFSNPMLLKNAQSRRVDVGQLITHYFKLGQIIQAYETFERASDNKALKVVIEG